MLIVHVCPVIFKNRLSFFIRYCVAKSDFRLCTSPVCTNITNFSSFSWCIMKHLPFFCSTITQILFSSLSFFLVRDLFPCIRDVLLPLPVLPICKISYQEYYYQAVFDQRNYSVHHYHRFAFYFRLELLIE